MSKWFTVEGTKYDTAGPARGRARALAKLEERDVQVKDDKGWVIATYSYGGDVKNTTNGGDDGAEADV